MARRLTLQQRIARAPELYPDLATALPASPAGATPTTSSELIVSGVPTGVAVRTPARQQDSGRTPQRPTPERIKDGQGSIRLLRQWASQHPDEMAAANFVRLAFEEPVPPRLRAPREYRNNGFFDGRLEFWGVMSVANEWDTDGWSTPSEFVEAFACEVTGHPKGDAVSALLRSNGSGYLNENTETEPEDDDYGKWRYGSVFAGADANHD